jgi:hypothetical protein
MPKMTARIFFFNEAVVLKPNITGLLFSKSQPVTFEKEPPSQN